MAYILQKIERIHLIYVRRIAGILAGLVIFTAISHVLNEMYADAKGFQYCRVLWHQFYEDEGKIDNLYLGSSHVYTDLDPSVLDRLNGQYNFNLASPHQWLNGSYYLLREAAFRNELQHVYLEMYYVCNYNDKVLTQYQANWKNVDYMKLSPNKAAYMIAIGGTDQLVNTLLPFSRYRAKLGDWDYVKKQLEDKSEESYHDYRYLTYGDDGNIKTSYESQGFMKCKSIYEDSSKSFRQNEVLSGYSMEKRNEGYCRSIIEYCQKKEIPITLFVSPIYELQLLSTLDYDDYTTKIRALAAEYGVPFYDFNLAKEEYLAIQDGKYFQDAGHLNQDGAELFTPFFYQVVSEEERDNEKYFYDSYREKLSKLSPTVYGVYYINPTEQEQMKTLWIASNRDSGMEYRIILTPDEGERYMVQDFQENKEFTVSKEEQGICTIVARMKESPDEMVQKMEIRY